MLETLPMWSNVQPQLQPHLGKPLTLGANVREISGAQTPAPRSLNTGSCLNDKTGPGRPCQLSRQSCLDTRDYSAKANSISCHTEALDRSRCGPLFLNFWKSIAHDTPL